MSRRKFLIGAGGLAVGTIAASAGLNLTDSKVEAKGETEWPWPYKKIDPEVARKKGHAGYYEGACCYGAFAGIIETLKEEIGGPYTTLPTEMMKYGEGGIVGWSTVCGAPNGAAAALTLIAGEDYGPLVDELMGWYTKFEFPSDKSNKYAKNHEFLVDKYKTDKVLAQSVADSPLCHASVTNWCKASGYASGASERSERCARLTGDVAAKAVELLNELHDTGKITAAYAPSEATEDCRSCHHKGDNYDMGQFTRGKMDCEPCHDDPHN
jgi:hypothetical protein